ncbi:hypothetical protein CEXT_71821 [Caerostris extrusa]|uniref:Uncharacterized protein n=1 Tax=Caerostris extrusa TaxID=172846 RepID=A0AAV4NI79_CAEEX|nr:hypothetical protein CEXT_71821 [Caerostris extrusa]
MSPTCLRDSTSSIFLVPPRLRVARPRNCLCSLRARMLGLTNEPSLSICTPKFVGLNASTKSLITSTDYRLLIHEPHQHQPLDTTATSKHNDLAQSAPVRWRQSFESSSLLKRKFLFFKNTNYNCKRIGVSAKVRTRSQKRFGSMLLGLELNEKGLSFCRSKVQFTWSPWGGHGY